MLKHTICIILVLNSVITTPVAAHFLWKVNTDQPSYLYGTIHSSDAAVRELPEEVIEALKSSSSFHPEIEFSPENMGLLTARIFSGGGEKPQEFLPPALWQRVLATGRKAGLPEFLLQQVPLQLLPLLFATPPGGDFTQIVDIQVYRLAKDNNLAVHPLETIEEQIGVFSGLNREEAISLLGESLDEFEAGFPSQEEIIHLYASQDLDALYKLVTNEFARSDISRLSQKLLRDRNHIMAKRLLPFLEEGGAFAAVGVAHMPGEVGLVRLLEQEGYLVSRLAISKVSEAEGVE